ncbi:MAG: hypothetical protein ACTHU1_11065 [Arachnia sp.]
MTLYTPVVFSDDPVVQAAARSRHWRVVERVPGSPHVLRMAGVSDLCAIPQPRMSIADGSLDDESAPIWTYALNWLERFVHRPMPVVAANDYATELALWAAASRGWPFGALINGAAPANTQQAVSLFTAADGFFIPDQDLATKFRSSWPAPVRMIPQEPLTEVVTPLPVQSTRRESGVTRLLLVGYYAGPCPTVGVQRINYWFEQFETLSKGRVTADLVLATPWPDAPPRVHSVRDFGPANLACKQGPLPPAAKALFESSSRLAYPIVKQVAGLWSRRLEEYFNQRDDEYDVVIISGNPFPPFEFARYAEQRWYARTILDYRDPFSLSPRIRLSPEAAHDAEDIERGWNIGASVVTVVNDACAEFVVRGGPDHRIVVIPNGYDERVQIPTRPKERAPGPVRLGHAGQIFPITPPDPLLRALSRIGGEFHHIGLPLTTDTSANVINHGRMTRERVLKSLKNMDCGVAYITESGIETPTKVFDYLAAGLDLLLLYRGQRKDTALASMLTGVNGVYWVLDEEEEIADWLRKYEPARHTDTSRAQPFSRRASTECLIELVLELGDHTFYPSESIEAH